MLRGSSGRFDMSSVEKKSALAGALETGNWLAVRRRPAFMKRATTMNFVTSAVLTGLAVHNFGVSTRR